MPNLRETYENKYFFEKLKIMRDVDIFACFLYNMLILIELEEI